MALCSFPIMAELAVWSVASYFAALAVHQVWSTSRFFGRDAWLGRRAMAPLEELAPMARTVRGGALLLAYGITLALLAAWFEGSRVLFAVAACLAIVRVWFAIRVAATPTVLFLSTSSPASIRAHRRLHRAARPLRVVALLDDETSEGIRDELLLDSFRTNLDEEWFPVFVALAATAAVVVVDAAAETVGLRRELGHLAVNRMAYKVLVFEPAGAGATFARQAGLADAAMAGDIEAACAIMTRALKADERPSPQRPLAGIVSTTA